MTLDQLPPNILGWIRENYLDTVIAGEHENKLLILLVCLSAFTKNPLSAVVKGPSGLGKSHLVNRILDIFRRMNVVIEFSRITGAYLENMAKREGPVLRPRKREEETGAEYEERYNRYREELRKPRRLDLTSKVLFIDELKGIQNAQAPKLLISEGRLRLGTVINGDPVEIEVIGTPAIITTTTLTVLSDPEFENRILPIQIDETEEQTKRVLEHEARRYLDPAPDFAKEKTMQSIVDFLNKLKPYSVANPYAARIASNYPTKPREARRDYPKLMNLSDTITWLYQYQRHRARKGIELFLITDPRDIDSAKALGITPLRESMSGVSVHEQGILDYLASKKTEEKDSFGNIQKVEYEWQTIAQMQGPLKKTIRKAEQWIRDHVNRLREDGYVEEDEYNPKRFRYRLAAQRPESLDISEDSYRYSESIEKHWADAYGYELLGPGREFLDRATEKERVQTTPLALADSRYSPNPQIGHADEPAGEFGLDPKRNGNVSYPESD